MNQTKLFVAFLFLFISHLAQGQEYPMTDGTVNTCGGLFYDDGGTGGGPYSTTSYTFTICPDNPEDVVQVEFFAFSLWTSPNPNNSDRLFIYDGPDATANSLGSYTGTQLQGLAVTATINNPSGCLTFVFQANPNGNTGGQFPGWEGQISCTTPCATPIAASVISDPAPSGDEQSIGVCIGDVITFSDNGSFALPGFEIANYVWNFNDGTVDNTTGPVVQHSFDEPGEYIVTLTIVDDNGCSSLNLDPLQVLVSTLPIFNVEQDFEICLGATASISANPESTTWTALPPQVVAGMTFLADGAGFTYSTALTFDFFEPGATLQSCDDFLGVFVNMEHSYLGDLGITLSCPDGTTVSILNWPNGGGATYLGEAVDDPVDLPGQNVPGIGYTYTWTPTATNGNVNNQPPNVVTFMNQAGFMDTNDIVPEGTYQPDGNLCDFVGCPLNGSWTLTITDNLAIDNGYVFFWGIDFNPEYFPDVTTFTPVIGMGSDSTFWDGPSITDVSADGNSIEVTPTETGTFEYTFSALNNFGCVQDTTITISVVPGPEADAGPDLVICEDSLQLAGGVLGVPPPPPNCNYTLEMLDTFGDGWNGFSVTIIQDGVAVGTYTFNTGLSSTATIPLNHGSTIQINTQSGTWDSEVSYNLINPAGDVVFSDQGTILSGTPIQIGQNIWSGTVDCQPESPDYAFEWSPTTGLSDPNIADPMVMVNQNTTYTLTVWEVGFPECSTTDEVTVSIPPEADPGQDNEIIVCYNEPEFTMTDSLLGTPVLTGEWTDAAGNAVGTTFNPSDYPDGASFTYTYTVTFGPCVKSADLTITVLEAGNPSCCQTFADAGQGGIACDLSFTLNAQPTIGTGIWSGPDGVVFGNPNSPVTTVTVPSPGGEYILTWTDDNGLFCEESDTVSVVFMDPVTAVLAHTPATCPGECNAIANLTPSGGLGVYTYNWSTGVEGLTPEERTNLCAAEMSVTVTDEFGCSVQANTSITESPRPAIQVSVTDVSCHGLCDGQIQVISPDAVLYSFDNGVTFDVMPFIEDLCAGNYQVIVENALECSNATTVTITEPIPVDARFTMSPNPTTWDETTIRFFDQSVPQPFESYFWVFDTTQVLGTSTERNPIFTFPNTEAGIYPVTLCVESSEGCFGCVTHNVIINETLSIFIPNSFTPNGDGINDLFKAVANSDEFRDFQMRIFNRQGELVFMTNNINEGWNGAYANDPYYVSDMVYIYEVRITSTITLETYKYTGHVTVLR